MVVGYVIYFIAILRHDMHDREFREMINQLFPCMIQRLYDEASVPEILGVDKRVLATDTVQMKSMKDPTHPSLPTKFRDPITIPRAQTMGLSVSINPSNAHKGDVGISVNIEIKEQREALDARSHCEGTLTTSSLAPNQP